MGEKIVLSAKGIYKEFPGVKALQDVSFFLREGEAQNAVFELGLYIVLIDAFAYIEASLHSA